jgi:WD40 repeat protein
MKTASINGRRLLLALAATLAATGCKSTHVVGSPDGGGLEPGDGAVGGVDGLHFDTAAPEIRLDVDAGADTATEPSRALSLCGVFGFGRVGRVAFSPDEAAVAVSGFDVVVLIDRRTGQHLREFVISGNPASLAFSPDGSLLVAGSTDHIRVWRVADGQVVRTIPLSGQPEVAYAPNGRTLAATANDALVVYAMPAGDELWRYPITQYQRPVFAVDSSFVAVVVDDTSTPVLLEPMRGSVIRTLPAAAPTRYMAFSSTGLMATVGDTGPAYLRQTSDGSVVRSLGGSGFWQLQFSADGKTFVAARGSTVAVWRGDDGTLLGSFSVPSLSTTVDFYSTPIALTRDGRTLLLGVMDATAHVVDLSQPLVAGQAVPELATYAWGHTDRITDATFSLDGQRVASASLDGTVMVWNVATGDTTRVLKHAGGVQHVLFAPDGSKVFSAAGPVYAWDLANVGSPPLTTTDATLGVTMAISRDGTRLATAGWYEAIVVRQTSDLSPILTIPLTAMTGEPLIFSPDGTELVSTITPGKLSVVRVADGAIVREHGQTTAGRLSAFALGDTRLIEAGANGIKLLPWPALDSELSLAANEQAADFAVSPSGRQLIGIVATGRKLLRLSDGAVVAPIEIEGQPSNVVLRQFSPVDNTRLLATDGNAARVYCRAPNDGLPIE